MQNCAKPKLFAPLLSGLMLLASAPLLAADHQVVQRNLDFGVKKISIKVGDTITFKNEDSAIHNVYSLSDANTFDLGGMPKGKAKTVTFDKPGTVEVECAVHTQMKLLVEVK